MIGFHSCLMLSLNCYFRPDYFVETYMVGKYNLSVWNSLMIVIIGTVSSFLDRNSNSCIFDESLEVYMRRKYY